MKLIFAPMATLSHEAFRHLIHRFGSCTEYYTEMIHASSLITKGPFEKYYLFNGPEPEKIVWQLTDSKIQPIIEAVSQVQERGGIGIDINMGCSAPAIFHQGAGISWMLKDTNETKSLIHAVKKKMDSSLSGCSRLSVKMRLGNEDFTQKDFFSFADMLVSEGVTQLVLHPRTRRQSYSRPSQWKYVASLGEFIHKKHGNHISIIGNGDIDSKKKLDEKTQNSSEIDGVMIGRCAVQKPWIFAELQGGASFTVDLYEIFTSFSDLLDIYQPKEFRETRMRRFLAYYCLNFKFSLHIQTKMLRHTDIAEQKTVLLDYFESLPEERYVEVRKQL